jgi:hypothetical protein
MLLIILTGCKSSQNISLDKESLILKSENPIYVVDIVNEFDTDNFIHNTESEKAMEEMISLLGKILLIHDDSRLSKVTFDKEGNIMEHWVYNKDSLSIRCYTKTAEGQTNYQDVKIEDMYDVDELPKMEKKMKDGGMLTIDSTNKVIIAGYDCFKTTIKVDEFNSIEHYFSDEIPRIRLDQGEGIMDFMLNTKYSFSLKRVINLEREGGSRWIEQPGNRRIDKNMEKYLKLNISTYSTIE